MRYRVEALEKFVVRTTYYVEAKNPKQAEALCRDGKSGLRRQDHRRGRRGVAGNG